MELCHIKKYIAGNCFERQIIQCDTEFFLKNVVFS